MLANWFKKQPEPTPTAVERMCKFPPPTEFLNKLEAETVDRVNGQLEVLKVEIDNCFRLDKPFFEVALSGQSHLPNFDWSNIRPVLSKAGFIVEDIKKPHQYYDGTTVERAYVRISWSN